jgi:hypothetical protein
MRGRITLAAAAALAAATVASGQAAAPEKPRPSKDDRATDCTSTARPGQARVRVVIWCGAQEGKVKLAIRRGDEAPLGRFPAAPRAFGPGAQGDFRCHRNGSATAVCRGRKDGPVTIRAWIAVPGERPCDVPLHLTLRHHLYVGTPFGCRPAERERVPRFAEILAFRRSHGLDLDLAGDARAIAARVRALQRAWLRGEPTARWTVSSIGIPMFARDQLEWEARQSWVAILGDNVYRWVNEQRLGRVFADYYVDDESGGIIHVGFTEDQEALVAAVERRFRQIPAERIAPFPFQPRHSVAALERLADQIFEDDGLWRSLSSVGVAVERNVVEVGTERVAEVRRLLAERFGPDAPISVVHEEPPRALASRALYPQRR